MKKTSIVIAGFAVIGVWFAGGNTAVAQTEVQVTNTQTQTSQDSYEFNVVKDNSLHKLARKAVQLYDQSTDSVSMDEAKILYAETNIVQSIGARLLEVGERVKIDKKIVADFCTKAQSLSESQKSAWAAYATNVDFALKDVTVANAVATIADSSTESTEKTDTSTTEGDKKPEEKKEEAKKDGKESSASNSGTPWYWWLIGIGTVGALYYLLGGRSQKEESSKK